jgi:uncharacterized protein YjbI with pentapeptide repeats
MRWREWLGVGERRWKKAPDEEVQPAKTLWDWLQLLIVPAILIGVTFAWSSLQTRSDRAAAEEARQDATLQGYLAQMSGLMLHEKLLSSQWDDPVRAVARTVTLATLRQLDGERKSEVVRFLSEARLINGEDPRVRLKGADLADANFHFAVLVVAYLDGVDLRGADLRGADLRNAYLRGADLRRTDLRGANLSGASLSGNPADDERPANLAGANLAGAALRGAFLPRVNFRDANIRGADFAVAVLVGADEFGFAKLEGADLAGAKQLNLDGFITALPPEGQKAFLDAQRAFLDSLSPEDLAKFNLSPEKLARFRREANGA